MEQDKNPSQTLDVLPRIIRAAKVIGNLFCLHQLASHGDHFIPEPPVDETYDQTDFEAQAQIGW